MERFNAKKTLIMTREQVRAFDQWAIGELGIPGVVLMENAAKNAADILEQFIDHDSVISILCGSGNNGGDGYVIARHLLSSGYKVKLLILSQKDKIKGDAKVNLDILEKMAGPIPCVMPTDSGCIQAVTDCISDSDMIVDAIFGTGLRGNLREGYAENFSLVNESGAKVFAIDIPSGLDCDAGQPLGSAIKADWTVTFVAGKKGYLNPGSADYTGEIFVAPIGISPEYYPAK